MITSPAAFCVIEFWAAYAIGDAMRRGSLRRTVAAVLATVFVVACDWTINVL